VTSPEDVRLLVPVADSVTLRETVAYALDQVEAWLPGGEPEVHFVYVVASRLPSAGDTDEPSLGRELLDRIEVWADDDLGEDRDAVGVETAVIGTDRYLFGPPDYASVLSEYADANDVDRIVLDPEYAPAGAPSLLQPLAAELQRGPVPVERAPIDRQARRTGLARAATLPKYLVVFATTLGFYLAIGELVFFDVVTGLATGLVVSIVLAPVAFGTQPSLPRLLRQLGRMVVYAPYLLWEITKANLEIAYVVLHPSLPIDPQLVEFRAAVWGDVPVTTLANSITLTPGTLTVSVADRYFTIHTLTAGSRRGLFEGSLERAVRFVFWGRRAIRIPSPRERTETAAGDRAEREGTAASPVGERR
jgi:multicomponent Na+:H+ antiporter subunit E